MKRMMAAILLLGFGATAAPANGRLFGNHPWFGRQTTTGYYATPTVSYYYGPAPVYYMAPVYTQAPIYLAPPPICDQIPQPMIQPPAMAPAQPQIGPPQRRPQERAVPEIAPPSERGPVVPRRGQSITAEPMRMTSLKPGENYFSTYSGGQLSKDGIGRSGVTFWNLSGEEFTIRVNGQTYSLFAGRSLTLKTGRQFSWQVGDRPEEAGRLSTDENSLTVVIRR